MVKISLVTLGCPKNLVDSDALLTKLREEGFIHTSNTEDAELVLVNTCGFIEDAKKESVEEILRLKHITEKGRKLLVFGCLAKRYGNELKKEIPEIDGLWGVGEEDKIVEYCKKMQASGNRREAIDKKMKTGGNRQGVIGTKNMPLAHGLSHIASSSYAYLKVAEGCSRGCTYCVIPSIRGPYRSVEPATILRKAEEHIRSGVRELVLVAQDLGNFGREFRGYELPSLVRDISSISGDFWVRLLYLNPSSINDELLTVIADEDKVCKYLDVPLQHSEDSILKAMGRGGTRKSIERTIRKIRETIPGIALRTTFIAGFPGETEEDFAGLKDFIGEMRFERLGVFTYSKEEGTPASRMKGHVPKKTCGRRRDEIMRLQSVISLEKNKALVGKKSRVLVDEVEGSTAIGRLSSQAPEIDGVVIIDSAAEQQRGRAAGKRHGSTVRFLGPGEFVEVEIVEAYDYDLKGVVVDDRGSMNVNRTPGIPKIESTG
jgi:ribosomal protein S12 methylthiotransferase